MNEVAFEQVRSNVETLTFEVSGVHKGTDLPPADLAFERIVVGVDGSKGAEAALSWANALAPRADARVWLIHVAPSANLAGPYETRGWVHERAYTRRLEGQAAELLEDAAGTLDPSIDARTRLVHGSPSREIRSLVDEVGADLVIVGSHGHSTAGRILLGSTADALKDRTDASLLVARNDPPAGNVLVPVDGSRPSTRAAAIALDLARDWKADLDLLHVFPLPLYSLDAGTDAIEAAFMGPALDWRYPRVDREIRFGDNVADEILESAEEHGSDVIVMGRRGLGPWEGLVAGSVSRRVLHGSDASVLLVRAGNGEPGRL